MVIRGVRAGGLVIAGAMILTACAGNDDPDQDAVADAGDPASDTDADPDPEPDPARTELIVGVGEDVHPGIEIEMKRLGRYPLQADICEGLVRLTEDFQVEGVLAESWEQDGNTLRFELRDGVTFTDGTPLDAEVVAESLAYQSSDPTTTGFSRLTPESAEPVDDRTVAVTPEADNMRLLEQINHPTYWITAPGSDPLEDPESVTCSGPFQIEEYAPESHLTVVRNEDHWGGEVPALERITFRFIPDDATRALELQSGDIDLAMDLDRAQIAPLEATPGLKVVSAPPGQVVLMYLAYRDADGQDKLLAERDLREAMAAAIDRQAYVDGVLDGRAEVVPTVNPPSVLGDLADRVEGIDHDPDRARQLLDDAGWVLGDDGVRERDGQRLELEMIYNPSMTTLPTAEFVQSQLADVGFDVAITQHADTASYGDQRADGDFDINIEAPNQNDANPAFLMALRWYSEATGDNVQYVMPGPDTRFDELVAETTVVDDPDELRELAADAMHELVDVEVATIPLAGTYRMYVMKEGIEGFEPHPSGTNQLWRTVFWAGD